MWHDLICDWLFAPTWIKVLGNIDLASKIFRLIASQHVPCCPFQTLMQLWIWSTAEVESNTASGTTSYLACFCWSLVILSRLKKTYELELPTISAIVTVASKRQCVFSNGYHAQGNKRRRVEKENNIWSEL